jgi:sirohydrochlorin ferrochelatase
MDIIIIIGHGERSNKDTTIEDVAKQVHRMIHQECTYNCVRTAYLQFTKPGIQDAIKDSILSGAKRIIIHPYFLSNGVQVTKNIPEIIKEMEVTHPEIEFIYTDPLGGHAKLAEVVLERIKAVTDIKSDQERR